MSAEQIKMRLPEDKIADFCRRHHIRKLAVFGSVLHGDSRPDSDLDILNVDFDILWQIVPEDLSPLIVQANHGGLSWE
jgi:predicted nucleotidyltransferase